MAELGPTGVRLRDATSIYEYTGSDAALDDTFAQARLFYVAYVAVAFSAAAAVCLPGAPLIPILVLSLVLNAVLLLPLLVFMHGLAVTGV